MLVSCSVMRPAPLSVERRDHDDVGFAIHFEDAFQHVDTAHDWEVDVEDHEVGPHLLELLDAFASIGGKRYVEAFAR